MKIAKRCIACEGTRLSSSPAVLVPFIALRVFGWSPAVIDNSWQLRDIPKGNALSVCNSVVCHECGMLFLDMRFDDEEMASLYAGYRGETYAAVRAQFEPDYAARNPLLQGGHAYLATVEQFIEPHVAAAPRVLDWGGDSGRNTPFRGRAAIHHIYDISGQPVIEGAVSVDLTVARATSYDLVVLSNVLEHVPAPLTTLRSISAVMHAHTSLYIEVPHEDTVRKWDRPEDRLAHKRHWHEHINFFSAELLDRVIAQAGLRVIERKSHLVSVAGREANVFSILARLK